MDEITTDNHAYSNLITDKCVMSTYIKGIGVTEKMAKKQRCEKHGDYKLGRPETQPKQQRNKKYKLQKKDYDSYKPSIQSKLLKKQPCRRKYCE